MVRTSKEILLNLRLADDHVMYEVQDDGGILPTKESCERSRRLCIIINEHQKSRRGRVELAKRFKVMCLRLS